MAPHGVPFLSEFYPFVRRVVPIQALPASPTAALLLPLALLLECMELVDDQVRPKVGVRLLVLLQLASDPSKTMRPKTTLVKLPLPNDSRWTPPRQEACHCRSPAGCYPPGREESRQLRVLAPQSELSSASN